MATAAWRTLGKCRILMNATAETTASAAAETTAKKPSGLTIPKPISPRLQDFMGCGPEAARNKVLKKLWGHIKLHNLRNPTDMRQIFCDEKLKTLFGKDKFVITETEIPGLVSQHFLHLMKKPKLLSGVQLPKPISPRLQDFMGCGPEAAKTEVLKKIWDHIKLHNLRNPTDMRQIFCDEKLKTLFGKDKFVVTEIPGLVSQHFLHLMKKPKPLIGIQLPKPISPRLQDFMGCGPEAARSEVLKKVWDHIKLHNLRDMTQIFCDEKLKTLFGKDKFIITEIPGLVSQHFLHLMKKPKLLSGIQLPKPISPRLQDFMGCGPEAARTEVFKKVWDHIRLHNLRDKRQIFCDEKLKTLFGKDKFVMTEIQGLVSQHFPHLMKKPKGKSGLQIPKPISPILQDFMGYGPEAAMTKVLKKLWDHIKLHNLQNPTNMRQIICDEKLKTLFGKDKFVITEIPGLLNKHFIKKV